MKRSMSIGWFLVLASLLHAAAPAAASKEAGRGPVLETAVGMEGVYYLRHYGSSLEALPVDDDSPVVLRIADAVRDGEATICEVRYIGVKPGEYDLRGYLRRVDGGPLDDVEPILVSVGSVLPADHNGCLEELSRLPPPTARPYRALLAVAGGLWLVPLTWLLVRRAARRRPRPSAPPAAEPTLADQLLPLVEGAVSGRLSTADQARLELLLIAYWRKRLKLTDCSAADALARLRGHPESAAPLGQLECWLHCPPGSFRGDLSDVLQPYRDHPPIDEAEIEAAEAPA